MGFTSEKLKQAVETLEARGHVIAAGGASAGPTGLMMVTVDGQPRTFDEIYEMVANPPDAKTKD